MSRIRQNYIETGLVRFIYKHVATQGDESLRAAEASECAADQGQFWPYHDRLFADQASTRSQLSEQFLIDLAAEIGLESAAFETCLSSGRYRPQIEQETELARDLGVRGTPAFVVNGYLVIGTQPYETFAQAFNAELVQLGLEPPADQAEAPDPAQLAAEIEGLVTFPPAPLSDDILSVPWQNCGIYPGPVAVENILRSMAHGAVWLAYRADLPAEQVQTLRQLVNQAEQQLGEPMIIMSPEPNLPDAIVLTAWQVQLTTDQATDPRLAKFLVQFQNGPFAPQAEKPCSGGVGTPKTE